MLALRFRRRAVRRRDPLRRYALIASLGFGVTAAVTTALVWASGRQMADWEVYRGYGDAMESGLVPYRDFHVEYPPGALPVFALPSLVTSTPEEYYSAFAALMALVGALGVYVTAISLRRLGRSKRTIRRVLLLLALSPLLFGGVLLSRFDLLPSVLVACALALVIHGRARWAAAVLGVAIAVKAFPVVVLPLLAAWAWRRHGPREAVTVVGITAGVVAAVFLPFLLLSPGGLADSLGGQLGRPLQVETLAAGILLVAHGMAGATVELEQSHSSDSLAGSLGTTAATVTSAVQAVVLVALWFRYARGPATTERTLRYAAALLVAVVALGKVLSPQFLIWCLFALPLVAGTTGMVAGACFAVAALATAIWYPALYDTLVDEQSPALSLLVLVRGLALVGVLVVLALPPLQLAPARPPGGRQSAWRDGR
jgi:hypothetical protein